MDLAKEPQKKMVKFVCMSDSHTEHRAENVSEGDVFIHCGDFTYLGMESEIVDFVKFLNSLKHKYKVVIAGNHDITLETERYHTELKRNFNSEDNVDIVALKKYLANNCIYLENSAVNLYGYNIFGSPYSVEFCGWAFMKEEKDLQEIWNMIPDNADIVLTHTPPYEILDYNYGSMSLRKTILERVKPLYHIFGHVHEGYGVKMIDGTTFVNASYVDINYDPFNQPFVFELPERERIEETGKNTVNDKFGNEKN